MSPQQFGWFLQHRRRQCHTVALQPWDEQMTSGIPVPKTVLSYDAQAIQVLPATDHRVRIHANDILSPVRPGVLNDFL
jgi:hypothetical protein